jgi:hypothetical protein
MLTFENATLPTLVGFSGGVPAVENLQRAMTALAMAAPWPTANPGGVTGDVNDATVYALAAILGELPGLPSQTKTLIAGLLAASVLRPSVMVDVKKAISDHAAALTTAVLALTLKYNGGNAAPPPPGTSVLTAIQRRNAAMTAGKFSPAGKAATDASAAAAAAASSFTWTVKPGTPWYRNWHVWAGVGGVAVAGTVAWRILR